MAFGSKKQAVIAKPSFKERLTVAKSMFKKAYEGTRTKAMYMATMDSVKDDVELSAVYTAYSKEVTD